MSSLLSFDTVDAFTTSPFSGNPASVVVLDAASPRETAYLQSLAAEFNLAETAFLLHLGGADGDPELRYHLRWFTPAVEMPLCGHATLASAHVLFGRYPSATSISFQTNVSGILIATKTVDGGIALDFPADHTTLDILREGERYDQAVRAAVKAAPSVEGHIVAVAWTKNIGALVELSGEVDLKQLKVDSQAFLAIPEGCMTFTQKSPDEKYDIYSRVFGPGLGISEDPVTGSAHCAVGPYWLGTDAARSRLGQNFVAKSELTLRARQVSPRGGEMVITWDPKAERMRLVGRAITVMQGTILV